MLVRYYDSTDGKFLDQGIVNETLQKGEPVIMDKKYSIVDILPLEVDWKEYVMFQPVLLKRQ